MSNSRRSIVTGGAGFIGSHLVDALVARGEDVAVIDDLSHGRADRIPTGVTFGQLDVADQAAVAAFAADWGPVDCWYHLAAQADVRVSTEDPFRDATVNVLGTISVLEAARVDGAQVVLASTGGAIYGDAPLPTSESHVPAPESQYGAAKLAAEGYVRTYALLHNAPHAIVRYANVYGPRQDPHGEAGVVAIFGGRALSGEAATIFGDGSQTRDYVYVGDVVAATLRAGDHAMAAARERGEGRVAAPVPLNIGTGIETSVTELWDAIARAASCNMAAVHAPARAGEVARSALDPSLAGQVIGWMPTTSLGDGIQATLEWMRADRSVASA